MEECLGCSESAMTAREDIHQRSFGRCVLPRRSLEICRWGSLLRMNPKTLTCWRGEICWGDLLEWSPMPTVGWWDKLGAAGSEVGE